MQKQTRHIVTFVYQKYAFTSLSKAADAVKFFSSVEKVSMEIGPETRDYIYYTPEFETEKNKVELATDCRYVPAKPPKELKPLALPSPKRGIILCICEKSYVAPKESCPHCGRPFSESHGRTHGSERQAGEQLKLD